MRTVQVDVEVDDVLDALTNDEILEEVKHRKLNVLHIDERWSRIDVDLLRDAIDRRDWLGVEMAFENLTGGPMKCQTEEKYDEWKRSK